MNVYVIRSSKLKLDKSLFSGSILDVMADRKEEIGNKERELKDSVYFSSAPS